MLSAKRDRKAAKRFFKKALSFNYNQIPKVITVNKNPAYIVTRLNSATIYDVQSDFLVQQLQA
jgi:transposase-like protein